VAAASTRSSDGKETPPGVLFREEQRFRQWWLWLLLIGVSAVVDVALVAAIVDYSRHGSNMTWFGAYVVPVIGLTITLALIALFYAARLTTEVRPEGLFIRFFPFHLRFKRILLDGATSCRAVTYSPIGTYGGWGIRYTWKGKAYNVYGNRGARIEFANGRHLLVGSQEPEELCAAINAIPSTAVS